MCHSCPPSSGVTVAEPCRDSPGGNPGNGALPSATPHVVKLPTALSLGQSCVTSNRLGQPQKPCCSLLVPVPQPQPPGDICHSPGVTFHRQMPSHRDVKPRLEESGLVEGIPALGTNFKVPCTLRHPTSAASPAVDDDGAGIGWRGCLHPADEGQEPRGVVGDTMLGPRHEMELLHLVPGRVTPLQGKGDRARSLKRLNFPGNP